jgi:hypothetical protein
MGGRPPKVKPKGVVATPMRISGGQATPNLHQGWSWPPSMARPPLEGLRSPPRGTQGMV